MTLFYVVDEARQTIPQVQRHVTVVTDPQKGEFGWNTEILDLPAAMITVL